MDPIKFGLPGYMRCLGLFVHAVNRAVASSSPLIGEIVERPTRHRGVTRNSPQPNPVEHRQEAVTINYEVPFNTIRDGDVEAFVMLLINYADEQFVRELERQFITVVSDVTHASGAVINAHGEFLSFDHVIDVIEAMEISNNELGGLNMPTIILNPETRKKLESVGPTAEQRDRLNAVLRAKYEENLRRTKTRKIGR